jgi:hypothetical protein
MRIDHLKSGNIDRSTTGNIQYQMVRGTFSSLLLINTTTWHYKDKITIKLRHEGGIMTIVDRVSAMWLMNLCDLKKGMVTTGSIDFVGTADGENNENGGYARANAGVRYYMNAFELPLGHISLSGSQQLEITVETATQAADAQGNFPIGTISISSIERKTRLDNLLTYDVSSDLEANQGNVREIYLCGKNSDTFFEALAGSQGAAYGVPQAKDINIKLSVDGDDSENSIEAYSAITAIDGQLTGMPSNFIRIYQDNEPIPAYIYIKVYGEDSDMAQILYVRETVVPHMLGQSMVSGLDREARRVEVLVNNEPERAAALIQTGRISSPEALKAASDAISPTIALPLK